MAGSTKTGVRAAKTAATRERMLKAARKLFTEGSYTTTTMQAIAAEAGVAVQTLYFTFDTKRAILKELLDVEIAGDTLPIASLERPWAEEALAATSADMLRLLAVKTAEVHSRVAAVLEVVRSAAATDPEIAELWRTNITQRHTVITVFTGALAAKGGLRPGVSPLHAADTALAIMTPETYLLLTRDRGWSNEEWTDWAADALVRLLLQ